MSARRPGFIRVLVMGAVLAALGGCATARYQCPTPNGVACMSAPEVYRLSNPPGKAGIDATRGALVDPKTGKPLKGSHGRQHGAQVDGQANGAALDPPTPLPRPGDVIPLREPARVMRIWIGPWEDVNGNLHMATRIYTEIEPKRWAVGLEAPETPRNFYPLQVESGSSAGSSHIASPGASAAAPGTESPK